MPAFHIVVKLLMLRLLLASLSGLSLCVAYDFGYHPSAEEFDSWLRDTRSWTRDLAATERRRESFVPRYKYEEQAPKAELDFQLYSDDQVQQEQQQQPFVYASIEAPFEQQQQQSQHVQSQLLEFNAMPTTAAATTTHSKNNSNSFPIFFTNPATGIVYAISEVEPNTKTQFWPSSHVDNDTIAIYVTKAQYDADMKAQRQQFEQQCPLSSNQAPLQSESPFPTASSLSQTALSTARPQIIRLQKPKKSSLATASKPAGNNKLPHRPPPVMVASGSSSNTISDQLLLKLPTTTKRPIPKPAPSRTHKPKRGKRKKKKKTSKRRPGHKPTSSTVGPQIVLGKRTTSSPPSYNQLATQLEKPHMPTATVAAFGSNTIFNEQPFAVSSGYMQLPHHLTRRSVEHLATLPAGARPVSSGRKRPSSTGRRRSTSSGSGKKTPNKPTNKPPPNSLPSTKNGDTGYRVPLAVHLLHRKHNGSEERSTPDFPRHSEEHYSPNSVGHSEERSTPNFLGSTPNVQRHSEERYISNSLQHSEERSVADSPRHSEERSTRPFLGYGGVRSESNSQRPIGEQSTTISFGHSEERSTSDSLRHSEKQSTPNSSNHSEKRSAPNAKRHSEDRLTPNSLEPTKNYTQRQSKKQTKTKARKGSSELDFDLFDLISGVDYEDNDDSYYDSDEKEHQIKIVSSSSTERPAQENSSSAEEGADFGAMEEELPSSNETSSTVGTSSTTETATQSYSDQEATEEQQQQPSETLSSSKNSASKKRIRRRPAANNNNADDYYDDKDDDEDDDENADEDSGIGSFFRMIFYPVQVAMSRLFDLGLGDQSDEQNVAATSKPKFPTYTLYHSAHSNNELIDDEDDDNDSQDDEENESSSLGSWFSSWFGPRRRTKKISSTTAMPPEPVPLPTPAPSPEPTGWLESWFGFGKTTTEASSEEDGYDKWFAGWFDTTTPKPKARRRKATSTTSSTTTTTTTMPQALPQVPILTIVDPLRNPQNWIGILAHHIVNSTGGSAGGAFSSTTKNPLLSALVTRMTSAATTTTTTEKPEETVRRISYDKYQIWRLKPQDEPQVRVLEQFKKGEDGIKLQWLKGPSLRGLTDVLVPPKMLVDFQGTLNFESIAHEVLIFDVGKAIAYERTKEQYLYTTPTMSNRRPTKQPSMAPLMTWNKYYEYDDILKYLEMIRMRHTQLVELIHIGRSYEGRPLIVVKIESKQTAAAATAAAAAGHKRLKHKRRSGQANAIFIEAGAQGQAWIGPASATWMISELLRLMRSNNSDMEFIRNTTWYIMPVLNPDGYAYSHEYDRFWKKSRSQHIAKAPGGLLDSAMTWLQQKRASEKTCYGVDLDRNWLYHWGKRGSSKGPCNEFYAGPAPFSEPETKAVSEFLMDYRTQIKLYISLQAYGQVVSYPVKANSTFNTERLDDFLDVAMVGTDSLRKKGSKSRYKVDSSNDLIEQRSGCADAFAAYEIGIPFSFTLQLADNGVHGYLLPSSAIEPTARDAFEIISGMLDYI